MKSITLFLKPLPPFRLDLTAWALRRTPNNLLDRWDSGVYSRILSLREVTVIVGVRQTGTPADPVLRVAVSAPSLPPDAANETTAALEQMLGLHVDLGEFYDLAAQDEKLDELARRFRGMKPPRFPTLFEGIANAVTCQQLSLNLGIQLLNRLAEAFGPRVSPDKDFPPAFPRPQDIAGLDPEAFRALGYSRRKGRTLIELARLLMSGGLDLEKLKTLDDGAAVELLCSLRGIGRWSAEYLLLRMLGRMNVFPADDVGGQKNLQRWLQLPHQPDYREVLRLIDRWQPFSGLIYFHLLLERLSAAGHLS